MSLVYTCLAAPNHLIAAGFSTIVARESDRIPLAAFKDGADASKYCDEKNGLAHKADPRQIGIKPTLTQSVGVSVTKAP